MPVLTILKQVIPLLKKYLIPLILVVLLLLTVLLYKQNKSLKQEVVNKQANIESYQGIVNKSDSSNTVLKLDITELKYQNDKLIKEVDSVRDLLKIKANTVTTAVGTTQHIDTVFKTKVIKDSLQNFDKLITPNKLTSIRVKLDSDSLSVVLKISNEQFLYVYNTRSYKHKKNFIKRLFTLDFKKITTTQYHIYNTNDLITIGDTRVIVEDKDK